MTVSKDKLPGPAREIAETYSDVWEAYSQLGQASAKAGPLSQREIRLVKLAVAIAMQSEGAVHSHARRARDEGLSEADLQHVALLAIPTLGFPRAAAAFSWLNDEKGTDE